MSKWQKTDPLAQLHTVGYTIIPGAINISDELFADIDKQSSRGRPIFGVDRKRKQCTLYRKRKCTKEFIEKLNFYIHSLLCHENYIFSKWVILSSLPESKRQPAHIDFVPKGDFTEYESCPDEEFPLAILCSLMNETKLNVWIDGKEQIIEMKKGDLLFFRGDFVHAGSAYDERNIRLHCYADNVRIPRANNRTQLIDESTGLHIK